MRRGEQDTTQLVLSMSVQGERPRLKRKTTAKIYGYRPDMRANGMEEKDIQERLPVEHIMASCHQVCL